MHLIIGGAYQGKTEYSKKCLAELLGHIPNAEEIKKGIELNLHLTIYSKMTDDFSGKTLDCLLKETTNKIEINQDLIITCDEVGMGIVPVKESERQYREQVGKVLQLLTKRACRVDRVIAGIPMRIK